MNNKGFTLVELLAVLVILLSVSGIVVTNVTASLKRNDAQELESQKKMAISAAKIYFSKNGGSYVSISKLISDKYLETSDVEKISDSYYVVICSNLVGYRVQSESKTTCSS